MQPTSIIMLFCIWIILYMLYLGIQFGRLHDEVREFRKEQKKPELIIQNNAPMSQKDVAFVREKLIKGSYYPTPPADLTVSEKSCFCKGTEGLYIMQKCGECGKAVTMVHGPARCRWHHVDTGLTLCNSHANMSKIAKPGGPRD